MVLSPLNTEKANSKVDFIKFSFYCACRFCDVSLEKKRKEGESLSHSPHFSLLQAKVNILPGILTLLAQAEVAWLQLNHLKLILHGSNLSWGQFTHLGAECHEASVLVSISEDATLEDLSSLLVCKLTDLHLPMTSCEGNEWPAVDDSLVVVTVVLCHSGKSLSGLWAYQSRGLAPTWLILLTLETVESPQLGRGYIPNPKSGGGGVWYYTPFIHILSISNITLWHIPNILP